jgi:hypothetical protein
MARGPQRLEAFAQALATGVPPGQAAKIAGYPNGSCFAHNARKRARRQDVKAMVAELQKQIEANFEFATEKLMSIASAELDLLNIKASDQIRAIEVLAKMHGWNAAEKTNVSGQLKIGRIDRIIVEPKNRSNMEAGRSSGDQPNPETGLAIPASDERMTEMRIVSINDAPAVRDTDGILRYQLTDLSRIVDNIDSAEGRNDALRAYIYALRDLQHAHDVSIYEENDAEIDAAQALVTKTFDQLIVAQLALNASLVRWPERGACSLLSVKRTSSLEDRPEVLQLVEEVPRRDADTVQKSRLRVRCHNFWRRLCQLRRRYECPLL